MTYPVNRACSPPCGKFRQRRRQQGELPFEKGSSCLVSRLNWPTREPEATALRGFSGSAHAIWLHGLVPPYSFRLLFASIRDGRSGVKREIFLLLTGEKALEIFGPFLHVRFLCSPPLVAEFVLHGSSASRP